MLSDPFLASVTLLLSVVVAAFTGYSAVSSSDETIRGPAALILVQTALAVSCAARLWLTNAS